MDISDLSDQRIEKLMRAELNMRTKISELEKEISDIKVQREKVQAALNDICRELNVTSIKTSVGTVIRSVRTKFWTDDWGSMYEFMRDNNAIDLLEKRICQGNMKEFLEANPDKLPPGLQTLQEYTVSVRKSKDKEQS